MANKKITTTPYAEFARRLARLRKDAELTQAEVAKQVGVSTRTYTYYESGERIPYADTAVALAGVFGISTDELLGVFDSNEEQQKARAAAELTRLFGAAKGKCVGDLVISASNRCLAGGELSPEDRSSFISTMQIILAKATLEASSKFTPYGYRTEDWEKRNAEQVSVVAEMEREVRARSEEEVAAVGSFFDDEDFHD